MLVQEIAARIEKEGGYSLLIDYGHDGTKSDTFRVFYVFHCCYCYLYLYYNTHGIVMPNIYQIFRIFETLRYFHKLT